MMLAGRTFLKEKGPPRRPLPKGLWIRVAGGGGAFGVMGPESDGGWRVVRRTWDSRPFLRGGCACGQTWTPVPLVRGRG